MKLSIFTTVTNPHLRGDLVKEPMTCYQEVADEVVIVNGGDPYNSGVWSGKIEVSHRWPQEFSWEFIGQQFQRGYEACTGDVVIHADLDFIFHERDYSAIRQAAELLLDNHHPGMSFWKYQFVLPDRYNLKSRLVVMVNKRDFKDQIRFNSGGDLCQPSINGEYMNPNNLPEARIPIYNYEKLLKTKEQISEDQGRMERAYKRSFQETQMKSDGSNENAFDKWQRAQKGKFNKPHQKIPLEEHPKVMQETIRNLTPERWGYNGFGLIEGRVYG